MKMEKSAYSKIKEELAEAIEKAAKAASYEVEDAASSIDFSRGFGDVSSSISFRLSKTHNKPADLIASEIKSKIKEPNYVEKITVEKGFINFHLDKAAFTKIVLGQKNIEVKAMLKEPNRKGERVIVEYVSVNPNKPWHIGHLRNALLGDSISNIYAALGYDVERENYIDDLGLQMAETAWWFLNKNNKPDKKFDQWLGEEYIKVNEELKNPDVKAGIEKVLALISQDGTYESKITRDIAKGCILAQNATAASYLIYQELLVWESDIVREQLLEKALNMLKNYGFVEMPKTGDYANCTIIDLKKIKDLPKEFEGVKEDKKVLVRSNGTATYVAKDIAFHMWKLGMIENTFKYSVFEQERRHERILYTTGPDGKSMDFANAKIAINIIDARQSHEQSVIKLAFSAMGKGEHADSIKHLAYGEVELESGALSGRKGTWLGFSADDLLRETQSKALKLISTRFKFGKEEEQKIVNAVALAAIKYEFLKMGPEKKIVFSWQKALNFEGNSGPYAQYMHARATRILEESPKEFINKKVTKLPKIQDGEFALVKLLSKQLDMIEKARVELRPNVITDYISDLAHAFASFYENFPILKAESEEQKAFRIALTSSFKSAMKNMLELLGIEALERM
jgi:arginyl-tRNA synthetase